MTSTLHRAGQRLAQALGRAPLDWRSGLQLTLAATLAEALPRALGLRESLWAVLSVLIVMRPGFGGTLGAGIGRIGGTVLGAACGLCAVWLHALGPQMGVAPYAVVAALAFAGGAKPGWRSAPVAALIIVSAGAAGDPAAVQVAALRVTQVIIGAGVALAVSALFGLSSSMRLRRASAALLRQLANRIDPRPTEPSSPRTHDPHALSDALARLAWLGESADREARWRRWPEPALPYAPRRYRRMAESLARVAGDFMQLQRLRQSDRNDGNLAAQVRIALNTAADALASGREWNADSLRAAAAPPRPDASFAEAALLAGPLHLLIADLSALTAAGRTAADPACPPSTG